MAASGLLEFCWAKSATWFACALPFIVAALLGSCFLTSCGCGGSRAPLTCLLAQAQRRAKNRPGAVFSQAQKTIRGYRLHSTILPSRPLSRSDGVKARPRQTKSPTGPAFG